MCKSDLPNTIEWMGWKTTWDSLRANGWEIQEKKPYLNWRDVKNSRAASHKIYIRHPVFKMIGRIILYADESGGVLELDYLTPERNQHIKASTVFTEELTADHIPALYRIILELQKANYAKPSRENKIVHIKQKAA